MEKVEFSNIKIGFLIHTAEMFHHYSAVWDKFNKNEFLIAVEGSDDNCREIIEACSRYDVNYILVKEVLRAGYRFPYFISNLAMHMVEDQPLIKVIGEINIRFMYALGKAKHNFSSWNEYYDLFLCFGPYHYQELSKFKAPVIQMGYPRYDIFFDENLDSKCSKDLQLELNCDPCKETILWLPTWLDLSSVDLYAQMMSSLMGRYNVIVKLHPLSFEAEPEKLEKLKALNFSSVITDIVDNVFLFALADKVVCDYGGTAFGAIYLDKPLLLLNVPGAKSDSLVGDGSPDITLRDDIVNINVVAHQKLYEIFDDELIWQQQKISRQKLRQFYFAPHYGFSSYVAAAAILNAKNVIAMYGKDKV